MEPLLTINQVSKRSGVAASALRYYEAKGLITAQRAGQRAASRLDSPVSGRTCNSCNTS
jgi:hypothetical protein